MTQTETLDAVDLKLLRLLQQNSQQTIKELAAAVNLSTSPVYERQKRLEREGYISRYVAVLDAQRLGNSIIVLCNIKLKQHSQAFIAQFMEAVQRIEEITDCWNTSGDFDFIIKVYARNMHAYQQFILNTLGQLECIGSLNSVFVIGEIKNSHTVPVLPQADFQ